MLGGNPVEFRIGRDKSEGEWQGPEPSLPAATGRGQHLAQVQTKILYLRKSDGDRCGTRCKGRGVI